MVQTIGQVKSSHRGRLEIIADILASACDGVKKTSIMYRCNLSFRQLEVYLGFLLGRGLLKMFSRRESPESRFFETTKRGLDFLRAYHSLETIMSD